MTCSLLFVYGTLRKGYDNPFAAALHAGSTLISSGTIPGRLFVLGNRAFIYPGATYEPDSTSQIFGEVMEMTNPETLLHQIDAYEGIGPNFPAPQEYVRQLVQVTTPDGIMTAWAYICSHVPEGKLTIGSGDFADVEPLKPVG